MKIQKEAKATLLLTVNIIIYVFLGNLAGSLDPLVAKALIACGYQENISSEFATMLLVAFVSGFIALELQVSKKTLFTFVSNGVFSLVTSISLLAGTAIYLFLHVDLVRALYHYIYQ